MIRQICIFCVVMNLHACARGIGDDLSGDWVWLENSDRAFFSLSIKSAHGALQGKYCAVMMSGSKIDCEEDFFPINMNDQGIATMVFKSGYSGQQGEATITLNTDSLSWNVTQKPSGEFFLPLKARLVKEIH